MHDCPGGCGRQIPAEKFLCNFCSHAAPDALVIEMAVAHDDGDTEALDAAAVKVRDALSDG